jgi:hypothetical protein
MTRFIRVEIQAFRVSPYDAVSLRDSSPRFLQQPCRAQIFLTWAACVAASILPSALLRFANLGLRNGRVEESCDSLC